MIFIYGCGHFSLCNTMQHVQIRSGKKYMVYNLAHFRSIWDIHFASCYVQLYVLSYNIARFEFKNVQLLCHLRVLMLGIRQISRRCEDLIYQSRWLETSWVIMTRCLIGYSDGAKVLFRIDESCNVSLHMSILKTWWRNQMETYFALLDLCVGHSPVVGEFPSQRPMTRSFDVFCRPHLNKRLSEQYKWFAGDLRCHRAQ